MIFVIVFFCLCNITDLICRGLLGGSRWVYINFMFAENPCISVDSCTGIFVWYACMHDVSVHIYSCAYVKSKGQDYVTLLIVQVQKTTVQKCTPL